MNTDIVKVFLGRVRAATASRSDEIRISTVEAQLLATALGDLLATRVEQQSAAPQVMTVEMDGGSIGKRP